MALIALVGALFAIGDRVLAAEPADCTLQRVAEYPLLPDQIFSPMVSIPIDGQPRKMLLDTGGFWSLLSPGIASSYEVKPSRIKGLLSLGRYRLDQFVTVPSVQIGGFKIPNADFYLAPSGFLQVDGTLGANWLTGFDVEIDPVNNTASLFLSHRCPTQVIYWPHSDSAVLDLNVNRNQGLITVPLKLNGRIITALIDTGSSENMIGERTAEMMFGVTPQTPGAQANIQGEDANRKSTVSFRYQFKTLELGDITFNNPWFTIFPSNIDQHVMILGMHSLHGLHLYFAYEEQKLYLTTARGDIDAGRTEVSTTQAVVGAADPLASVNSADFIRTAADAIQIGKFAEAQVAIDEALKLNPKNAEAYAVRSNLRLQQKRRPEAIADMSEAIHLASDEPRFYVARSEIFRQGGDIDKARDDVVQALRINVRFVPAYLLRAQVNLDAQSFDQALQDLDIAGKLEPKNPGVPIARAHFYALHGDYVHALAEADEAFKLAPKSAVALNNRCWFRAVADKLKDALDDCDDALALLPKSSAILDSRGFVYMKLGQLDAAIADYTAALVVNPRIATSLYGRGLAKQKKGDASGAAADMDAAGQIDPHIAENFGK